VLEKGFEGDVIISGLAEHLRNLLLCKDQRMAKLLDVPNDHKPVYFEKANQAPPAFILSALNAVSAAELEYKNATNKRLHIELCLIRLCYLLQATQAGDVKKNTSSIGIPAAPPVLPVASTPAAPPVTQQAPPAAPVHAAAVEEQPPVYQKPQPQVVQQPQPQQSPTAPQPQQATARPQPTATAQPATPPPAGRRISRNLIDDIDAQMANNAAQKEAPKELTKEMAEALYDKYKKRIQADQKNMLYSQLTMLKLEVHPPDEIKLVAPSEITEMYALDQRNELLEYFRAETGLLIRVTTAVEKDETVMQQQKTVLSKPEIFEEMMQKNPELRKLREGLNLQIEY
jgi:DNA polymerase-3 subunit gamma/tau